MKNLIVGNWKMHLNIPESTLLIARLHNQIYKTSKAEVVLCPGFVALDACKREIDAIKTEPYFELGAQNIHEKDEGAFTGEVSVEQIKHLVSYAIVGHSERRQHFHENDKQVSLKIQLALRHDILPILCIGETYRQRHDNLSKQVVLDQLEEDLDLVSDEEISKITIAYEPIWAIGTGEFAKPDDVKDMADLIEKNVKQKFGKSAKKTRILYGGSVDEDNCRAYLDLKNINGLLVGGASLNYRKFSKIVNKA